MQYLVKLDHVDISHDNPHGQPTGAASYVSVDKLFSFLLLQLLRFGHLYCCLKFG